MTACADRWCSGKRKTDVGQCRTVVVGCASGLANAEGLVLQNDRRTRCREPNGRRFSRERILLFSRIPHIRARSGVSVTYRTPVRHITRSITRINTLPNCRQPDVTGVSRVCEEKIRRGIPEGGFGPLLATEGLCQGLALLMPWMATGAPVLLMGDIGCGRSTVMHVALEQTYGAAFRCVEVHCHAQTTPSVVIDTLLHVYSFRTASCEAKTLRATDRKKIVLFLRDLDVPR